MAAPRRCSGSSIKHRAPSGGACRTSDAEAFAKWEGKALPTEAEWELAARGGLHAAPCAWGDTFLVDGRHMANTWQGDFPLQNLAEDGFEGTSPVDAFPPNGYGLHDMIGNVWEWTMRWHRAAHRSIRAWHAAEAARTREEELRLRPAEYPDSAGVDQGGSHLCAPNYRRRYRQVRASPNR